jgi:hypothetical protein
MVIIDHRYGPNVTNLNDGYWHSLQDTPDKVSAESLETVARLVELGLRSGAWMEAVTPEDPVEEPPTVEPQPITFAGPLGLLMLGWAFVIGLAGISIVAIVALRRLRPPPASTTWSWDEA